MVTIKQVAELAGVSKSTVSRYISRKGYVGKEAAEKIEAAIKSLNFVPNLQARTLKTKKSQLVGLLLPDISNPFFPLLAKGVEEYFQERGYQVLLGNVSDDEELEENYLRILQQSNVAGIISTSDFSERHPDLEIPVVMVDRATHKSTYSVLSDNRAGGRLAAEVVVRAGTKSLALVSGPVGPSNVNLRYRAALAYLKKFPQISVHECLSASYDFEIIQKEAKAVLEKYPHVDTIIAPSDIHAMAFIHEILNIGKKIPEDIQLIGYDDISLSQFIYPPLSTIHQSAYRMGAKAAELIYKIANNEMIAEKHIELPVRYVERETIRK